METTPMTVDQYCQLIYGTDWNRTEKLKQSKRHTVTRMCRDGVLQARKSGKRWLIWI